MKKNLNSQNLRDKEKKELPCNEAKEEALQCADKNQTCKETKHIKSVLTAEEKRIRYFCAMTDTSMEEFEIFCAAFKAFRLKILSNQAEKQLSQIRKTIGRKIERFMNLERPRLMKEKSKVSKKTNFGEVYEKIR